MSATLPEARADAAGAHRTEQTGRLLGAAHRGPELHQRLVPVAGPLSLDQCRGEVPEPLLARGIACGALDAGQPRQNTGDIPVHERDRAPEGDGGHRAHGVPAEAGERAERLDVVREPSAVPLGTALAARWRFRARA
jgi:hypothetical protein